MPALSVLLKPSSGMCNMACDYCFYCDETEKRKQESYGFMSEETLRNVIRKTLPRAEFMISYAFQGGEPTLRGLDFFEKVVQYERQYNLKGIRVANALQTNGSLLDDQWCRFLKENHFLVGVSLDGIRPVHDLHRRDKAGEPTYDRILANIRLLDQYQVDYNILTVVNKDVAARIQEIYHAYQKKGWNFQQYIVCLDPLDEPKGQSPYAISPEEYGIFLCKLFDLWYEDYQKGCQPYIRQFENYIGILTGIRPEACDQRGICGIQTVVEADGSVYPCDFYMLDQWYLGNFNEDRLPAIDERRQELGFIARSQKLTQECRACPYFRLCRGGCQRNRDLVPGGDLYVNYFCPSYKTFFAHSLERMEGIARRCHLQQ